MFSLAPYKYRNILVKDGGPIQRLEAAATTLWDGSPCYSAAAYLQPSLRPSKPRPLGIYDDADGGGTNRSRNIACFVAVSEALERWAYYSAGTGPARSAIGFDLDDSTTGMAAFPALTGGPARRKAGFEAAERWSLLEWWRGNLPGRTLGAGAPDTGSVAVTTPFKGPMVVILWARSAKFGGVTYGFSADESQESALRRASVELTRNLNALGRFYEKSGRTPATVDVASISDPLEKRLVYFSTPRGFASFQSRVAASAGVPRPPPAPTPVVDREVEGPWSRYARVWRILYRHEGGPDDESDVDVFAF